jgi:glycosyltransferase involved in cell wall biosynthesis
VKDISLCMAYYENRGMLAKQYEQIRNLPIEIREHLEVVVCDDGSPDNPAWVEDIGCKLQVYRIEVDIRWNQDAARNICCAHATKPWLLLTDMDHMVPMATWRSVMRRDHDEGTAYQFGRVSAPRMEPYKKHPNSYLMHRSLWDKSGGYDERFAGFYGTDSDYKHRLMRYGPIVDLKEPIIRVPREVIPDASTTRYSRKAPEDKSIRRIRTERNETPGWRPLRLTFPYHRVEAEA